MIPVTMTDYDLGVVDTKQQERDAFHGDNPGEIRGSSDRVATNRDGLIGEVAFAKEFGFSYDEIRTDGPQPFDFKRSKTFEIKTVRDTGKTISFMVKSGKDLDADIGVLVVIKDDHHVEIRRWIDRPTWKVKKGPHFHDPTAQYVSQEDMREFFRE